jgi:hypothetical protein
MSSNLAPTVVAVELGNRKTAKEAVKTDLTLTQIRSPDSELTNTQYLNVTFVAFFTLITSFSALNFKL